MWNVLVLAKIKEAYEYYLGSFEGQNQNYIEATKYYSIQWLLPYKKNFVVVWVNKVMHFNNTTTNRYTHL